MGVMAKKIEKVDEQAQEKHLITLLTLLG